jgi:hypothetical protein
MLSSSRLTFNSTARTWDLSSSITGIIGTA